MITDSEVKQMIEHLVEATTMKFGEYIDIIAVYGSRSRGDHSETSDLEMFAVVNSRKKSNVEWFFLYNGIPVDLWTMEWESIEKSSRMEGLVCLNIGTLLTCDVVYYRNEEIKQRFLDIRQILKNLDQFREKHVKYALEIHDNTYKFLGKMHAAAQYQDLFEMRIQAWNIINSTAIILARINSKYYLNNWGKNISEAIKFEIIPPQLINMIEILSSSNDFDAIMEIARELIEELRKLLIDPSKLLHVDETIHCLNTEVGTIEYFYKIRNAAKKKDIIATSYAIFDLQPCVARDLLTSNNQLSKATELLRYDEIKTLYDEFGFPDFTNAVSDKDYDAIIKLTDVFEEKYRSFLTDRGHSLREFTTMDELQDYLDLSQ